MPLSRYKVIDVMQRSVASVDLSDPAHQIFVEIAAAEHGCFVVVDDRAHPVGILTQGDVVRMVLSEQVPGGDHLRAITTSIEAVLEHLELLKRAGGDTVADCMTAPVVTVDEEETLQRVAEIFADQAFHSLPVVRDAKLVGLVRRVDLLGPIMQVHDEARRARGQREPKAELS